MTDIQEKAQALMDAMRAEYPEVSDGALEHLAVLSVLEQNKIKPDPLADAVESVLSGFESRKHAESYANQIRAALEARGFEIRKKHDG